MQILANRPLFNEAGIMSFAAAGSAAPASSQAGNRVEDLTNEELAQVATTLFYRIFRFKPLEEYARMERKALLDRIEMLSDRLTQ